MLLLCCAVASSASAIFYETYDFVGTPGMDVWTATNGTGGGTNTGFADYQYGWDTGWQANIEASGQGVNFDSAYDPVYSANQTKYIWNNDWQRDGEGDFDLTVRFDNIALDTTTGWNSYSEYHWAVNDENFGVDTANHRIGFKTWDFGDGNGAQLFLQNLSWDSTNGFYGHEDVVYEADGVTPVDAGTISSIEMQIGWRDTAGVGGIWSAEFLLNAGLADERTVVKPDVAYLRDALPDRWDYLWGSSEGMQIDLDYYSMTPEPATMALLGLGGILLRRKRA